jgi:tRNA modification GTPase
LTSAKNKLIDVIVRLESALEFVEDDLPQLEIEDLTRKLSEALVSISGLTETYRRGHLLQDGLRVAIVGRPNVGKSSLFNSLLRLDRAIVTDIAGTTRDSITEGVALQGVPVLLTDTAGIREASDEIEKIGVQRTNRAIADSDLLLIVLDGSQEIDENDKAVLKEASHSLSVVVVNKCDLPAVANLDHHCDFTDVVHVSALTGEGFEELTAAILEPFGSACTDNVGLLITNSRHYDLLRRTQNSLDSAMHLLSDQAGEELVLADLHNALRFLGEITGETTTEDILSEIFSTFCIGK